MMTKPIIGIIGGKGRMGSALVNFFKNQDYTVLISDRKTSLSNRALAKKVDVIIVSVNIDKTQSIIEKIAPHVRKSSLLMDITSVKEMPVKAMLTSKASVIGLHPMCNETTFGPGQTMIYCPARPGKWSKWLRDTFEKRGGFNLIKLSPKKHDETMGFVQALIHFSEIALGQTLKKLDPRFEDLMAVSSPASQIQFKIAARHLAQDPNLYGNIQIKNKRNVEILNTYQAAVSDLYKIVEAEDLDAFTRYFNQGKRYFGKFGKKAFQDTDAMIRSMIESKKPKSMNPIPPNSIVTLGPNLSYTSLAAKKWNKKKSLHFLKTIEEVISAIDKKKAKIGIVPIENKIHGTVRSTMDNLFEKNVKIIGEWSMPIRHTLATLKGVKKEDVKKIISHTQALNQCSRFLKKELPNARWIQVESTVTAFEYVQEQQEKNAAVIGPLEAVKNYGFKRVASNIANDEKNETTFIAIAKEAPKKIKKRNAKTSVVFHFDKDKSGSLFEVSQIFAEAKINLTRIESRPAPRELGEYLFFLDFEESAHSKKGIAVLKKLSKVVGKLKWLGTY
jgi:prephenate dehydratase/prephenate dehydrogenase